MSTAQTTRQRRLLPIGLVLMALAVIARPAIAAQAQPQQPPARPATLDEILKEVSAYNGGIESAPMWKLRDYVYARKDDPAGRAECEGRLVQYLRTAPTPIARMAAARALRLIGGDTAVVPLQAMLADDRLADAALYALQEIPGAAADKALLQALATTAGTTRNAVIAALGERRVDAAVPALALLVMPPASNAAAAVALGRIGGEAATKALLAIYGDPAAGLKVIVARGLLMCAERQLAAKNPGGARGIYEPLAAELALPIQVRQAATMGWIASAGSGAPALVLDLLGGTDAALQEAAIAGIRDAIPPDGIGPMCALLPRLPEAAQVQLLAVLAAYPRDRVLAAVLQAARSDAEPVRLAAMKALEATGGPAEVPFLAETAAAGRGSEQAAVRMTLAGLRGSGVDEAILTLFAKPPSDDVAGELLLAMADRRMYPARHVVAGALASSSARIRTEALRALRTIGTPSDTSAVLDFLLKTSDEAERAEAGKTAVALAQKEASPDGRAGLITGRLADAKAPEDRVRLLALLPQIGDNTSLPVVRKALGDSNADVVDAAVRAFTAWPTAAARDDVFRLARDSRNETHRLLAIGAFIQSVSRDTNRNPDAAVADLLMAAAFSWRPEEQKLVLGALTKFPCPEALDLAKGFLQEPAVMAEAQAAINNITKKLTKEMNRK